MLQSRWKEEKREKKSLMNRSVSLSCVQTSKWRDYGVRNVNWVFAKRLFREISMQYNFTYFPNSSADYKIRYAESYFVSLFFNLSFWHIISFAFRPALLCSLSLPPLSFCTHLAVWGTPRCLLNWNPALAPAASQSRSNTEKKYKYENAA